MGVMQSMRPIFVLGVGAMSAVKAAEKLLSLNNEFMRAVIETKMPLMKTKIAIVKTIIAIMKTIIAIMISLFQILNSLWRQLKQRWPS